MHKPTWSWANRFTRLGSARRNGHKDRGRAKGRRLRLGRLEQGHLRSTDLAIGASYADGNALLVDYEVSGDAEDPEDLEFRDRLYGGPGDDGIMGRLGPDTISGEEGDDSLEGWAGDDTIYGGPGNDVIEGWSGSDELYGDAGDDIITGGLDDAVGADGDDTIYGGPGDDRIDGWRGDDTIYGDRKPDDPLYGEDDGNDEIYGGDGEDKIYGGGGHDNLFGEEGFGEQGGTHEELYGQDGDDLLYGGPDGAWVLDGGAGQDFIAQNDLQNWPDELPWPELNLVADPSEVVDDGGPNWNTEGPLYEQWQTEQNDDAFADSQSVLEFVQGSPRGNKAKWFGGIWAEEVHIYVTWAPRAEGLPPGAQEARFTVHWWQQPYIDFWVDQRFAPNDVQIDGQWYEDLGTFPARHQLWVQLWDDGVDDGESLIADAVLFRAVGVADQARPGSRTNRDENGFYQGLQLYAADPTASCRRVDVRVDGLIDPQTQQSRLPGRSLKLQWEGDGTIIEVYSDPEMRQRIYSGGTWEIGQITEIYVKGVGEGTSELVLSLAPIENDPFAGERPISDLVVVNVNT